MSIGQTSSFTGFNFFENFSSRLQPNEIWAASAATAIEITYNFVDPVTAHNDGVVYGITNNLNSSRSQTFTYDQLNRISSAGTSSTTGTYCWGYQFNYDTWGNLLSQAGWSPTYNACTETIMGSVTANGNNQIFGLTYDASGNTLTDGSYTYTWNGESQMKTAGGVTYTYDGDGCRASKVGSKLYWYGSGCEILSETDASGNTLNDYVFFGGKRVALVPASGSALYYAEDLLGSSRVIVESNGTLCYDGDFTPFGGERAYTSTCSQNYKFEGKERDTETANDNFDAREYTWRFGRWLSSDWSATPAPVPYANLSNPQTLNLYAMVSDDPESFADLDGHCGEDACVVETLAGATILVMATQAYFAMPPEQRNFGASLSQAANSVGGAISGLFQSSDNSKTAPQSNPAPGAQSGTQAVQPYDVGEAKDLQGRSVPGDNVDIHHVPQQNPASQTVAGYDGKTAPAMGVPKDEHKTIPTEKGEATRTPRDQLAKDARDLRNKTNASNSQVQKVIDLNKQKYPEMMKKPAKNDND